MRYATREARRDKHYYGYDSHDPITICSKRTSGAPSSSRVLKCSPPSVPIGTTTRIFPRFARAPVLRFSTRVGNEASEVELTLV